MNYLFSMQSNGNLNENPKMRQAALPFCGFHLVQITALGHINKITMSKPELTLIILNHADGVLHSMKYDSELYAFPEDFIEKITTDGTLNTNPRHLDWMVWPFADTEIYQLDNKPTLQN